MPSYYRIFIIFKISKIKIGRENRNRVCLHIITIHYIISNFNYFLIIFIVQIYIFFLYIFTYKVPFIRIGKSIEVRGNGDLILSSKAIFCE